jgi:parallel beta-helix repeat protein
MLPKPLLIIEDPIERTPHAAIYIDGDANFSDTALLEGWPGDGSPENPYIIDGLEIARMSWLGMEYEGSCISIYNTQVSFIISNCNLTGAGSHMIRLGFALHLVNVSGGLLLNNMFHNNEMDIGLESSHSNILANNTCKDVGGGGISLYRSNNNFMTNNTCGIGLFVSDSNIVANNNCSSNEGIEIVNSHSNTVVNNTCNFNPVGIYVGVDSTNNTVTNNICNFNDIGIYLNEVSYNTISTNICNNNRIGICLHESPSNTGSNNICLDNTEHDILGELETEESVSDQIAHQEYVAKQFVWFLAGSGMILVVSVIALVQFRRMEI